MHSFGPRISSRLRRVRWSGNGGGVRRRRAVGGAGWVVRERPETRSFGEGDRLVRVRIDALRGRKLEEARAQEPALPAAVRHDLVDAVAVLVGVRGRRVGCVVVWIADMTDGREGCRAAMHRKVPPFPL